MERLSRKLSALCLILLICFTTCYAFAQDVAPVDFFTQVLTAIKTFGGLSWVLKISSIVTLLIASMKVSFLNQYLWTKLGAAQAWVAPILGLIAGILSLMSGGQPLSIAALLAYLSAGSGAIILHELLDSLKALPGLGAIYVAAINVIENVLGGPASLAMKAKR